MRSRRCQCKHLLHWWSMSYYLIFASYFLYCLVFFKKEASVIVHISSQLQNFLLQFFPSNLLSTFLRERKHNHWPLLSIIVYLHQSMNSMITMDNGVFGDEIGKYLKGSDLLPLVIGWEIWHLIFSKNNAQYPLYLWKFAGTSPFLRNKIWDFVVFLNISQLGFSDIPIRHR